MATTCSVLHSTGSKAPFAHEIGGLPAPRRRGVKNNKIRLCSHPMWKAQLQVHSLLPSYRREQWRPAGTKSTPPHSSFFQRNANVFLFNAIVFTSRAWLLPHIRYQLMLAVAVCCIRQPCSSAQRPVGPPCRSMSVRSFPCSVSGPDMTDRRMHQDRLRPRQESRLDAVLDSRSVGSPAFDAFAQCMQSSE